jgi:hypothetical protein
MATDKLKLYNTALTQYLGERRIASLSENREPRRALDDIWDNGAVKFCLEEGHWKFAQRVIKLPYTSSITPAFGYRYAFTKPSDCVKVSKVCSDEYLKEPLIGYTEEAGFWSAEIPDLYLSYVSDDVAFGGDMSLWPESFVQVVALYLAKGAATRITGKDTAEGKLLAKYNLQLTNARSKDAMQGPTQFTPTGSWVRVRGGGGPANDGGSRSTLIG